MAAFQSPDVVLPQKMKPMECFAKIGVQAKPFKTSKMSHLVPQNHADGGKHTPGNSLRVYRLPSAHNARRAQVTSGGVHHRNPYRHGIQVVRPISLEGLPDVRLHVEIFDGERHLISRGADSEQSARTRNAHIHINKATAALAVRFGRITSNSPRLGRQAYYLMQMGG